jgi:hypothetical protein
MGLGYTKSVTHDYAHHDATTLFAALDVATGEVITQCKQRHWHQEFLGFLRRIEHSVPSELDVHMIVDYYCTHKHTNVRSWQAQPPAFISTTHPPMPPDTIRRQLPSVKELIAKTEFFVASDNKNKAPFAWTATADSILEKLSRLCAQISGTANRGLAFAQWVGDERTTDQQQGGPPGRPLETSSTTTPSTDSNGCVFAGPDPLSDPGSHKGSGREAIQRGHREVVGIGLQVEVARSIGQHHAAVAVGDAERILLHHRGQADGSDADGALVGGFLDSGPVAGDGDAAHLAVLPALALHQALDCQAPALWHNQRDATTSGMVPRE